AFLQVSRAGRGRNVGKTLAANIFEHAVGDQHVNAGVAGAQVEVEIAVVVEVGEVAAHGGEDPVHPRLCANVLEALAAQVAVYPRNVRVAWGFTLNVQNQVLEGGLITGREDVQPAI